MDKLLKTLLARIQGLDLDKLPPHNAVLQHNDNITFATAGVLVISFIHHQHPHILLTKRAADLANHPGQISFPGGKPHAQDNDLMETALRETHEEIGIMPSTISILTALQSTITATGYCIHPWLATVNHDIDLIKQCKINHQEVSELIALPLIYATDLNNYQEITKTVHNIKIKTWQLQYEQHLIWGATAVILHQLARIYSSN